MRQPLALRAGRAKIPWDVLLEWDWMVKWLKLARFRCAYACGVYLSGLALTLIVFGSGGALAQQALGKKPEQAWTFVI